MQTKISFCPIPFGCITAQKVKHTLLLIILIVLPGILSAQTTEAFYIGNIEAKTGQMVSGNLIVEQGIDQGTFIPVSIIKGTKPGPVLTLSAGIHGTEYVPVITLQKLRTMVKPEELSGTLVLVHLANILSFQQYMVYNNPVDHKNLNRTFPGKKDGTLTERIAHTLATQVYKKSDYYIDLHGGEFNERIIDYLYFSYNCPSAEQDEKSYMMAHATGNKYLFPFDYTSVEDTAPSEYTDIEAIRQGAAAVTLEWGDRGAVPAETVETATKGMINVMRKIGMLKGETFTNEHPVYLGPEQELTCNNDGIFYPLVDRGQYVTRGTLIGYTTDYHGEIIEEYHAPISGIIVVVITTPAIYKGKDVCSIAEILENYEKQEP